MHTVVMPDRNKRTRITLEPLTRPRSGGAMPTVVAALASTMTGACIGCGLVRRSEGQRWRKGDDLDVPHSQEFADR